MNAVQILLLIASGAGAFYAASDWSRQRAAPGPDSADEIVAAVPPRPPASAAVAAPPAASAADDALALPKTRTLPGSDGNAFGALSWSPPPPPPPVVAVAAPPARAPTAPPLPFTFVGMVERGAETPQAYIAKGDSLLIVAQGDVIDNQTYRVEALLPTAIVFTYLPLDKRQTLNALGVGP